MKAVYSILGALGASTALAVVPPTYSNASTPNTTRPDQEIVPSYSFDQLFQMTDWFFQNFTYPNNVKQAQMINSTIFSEDVLGRIDATRDFNGRELNTEYGFGLFANLAAETDPDAFSLLGVPISYNITHFVANQNIFSAALIINFNITALNLVSPVEVDMWGIFNAQGQLSEYDITFRYLSWQFNWLYKLGQMAYKLPNTNAVQDVVTDKLATSICSVATRSCNGTNQQYDNATQCHDYLTKQVRLGEAYELGMNTLMCRMVHQSMVQYRPSVHCPHIGPSGGGYCDDDRTYSGNVLEPYFTNEPFIPYGYAAKNSTIAAE